MLKWTKIRKWDLPKTNQVFGRQKTLKEYRDTAISPWITLIKICINIERTKVLNVYITFKYKVVVCDLKLGNLNVITTIINIVEVGL